MNNLINDQQILQWLNTGWLEVNSETMEVKFRGRKLKTRIAGIERYGTRYIVQLGAFGTKRTIMRSKLVWMGVHRKVVPEDWEIHHVDEDRYNDRGNNLVSMQTDDHYELHNGKPSDSSTWE